MLKQHLSFLFLLVAVSIYRIGASADLLLYFALSTEDIESGKRQQASNSFVVDAACAVVAIDHVNNRNGTIIPELGNLTCPVTLEFTLIDTVTNFANTLASYFQYKATFSKLPNAIIGPFRSSTSIPLSFVSSVDLVPIIGYSSTSLELDDTVSHPLFTRTIPSDSEVATSIITLLASYGYPNANVIYIDDAYGKTYKDVLFEVGQDLGIELGLFPYKSGDSNSIAAALRDIQATKLNIIIAIVFNEEFDTMLLEAYDLGLTGAGSLWIFSDSIGSIKQKAEKNQVLAHALNGTLQIIPEGGKQGDPNFQRFIEHFEAFDQYIDYLNLILPGGNQSFDFGDLTIKLNTSFFSEMVDEIPYFGTYAFDAVLSLAFAIEQNCDLFFKNNSDFNLVEILTRSNFSFNGVTGEVRFNEFGSRDLDSASIIADNFFFNEDGEQFFRKRAARWENQSWNVEESIRFPPGDEEIPPPFADIPKHEMNNVEIPVRAVIFLLTTVLLIAEFTVLVWTSKNYRNNILRAQQTEFLLSVVIGCVILTSAVFFIGWDESQFDISSLDLLCNVEWWLISIGLTLIISGFIGKLYRLVRLFESTKTLQPVVVKSSMLIAIQLLILIFDLIVLTLWAVVGPLKFERKIIEQDIYDQPIKSVGLCVASNESTKVFIVVLILSVHSPQFLIAAYFAYHTQTFPPDFQDTKWVGSSFFIQSQILLLGVPVTIAIDEESAAIRFLVLALMIDLASLSNIVLLFAPKVYRMRTGPKEAQLMEGRLTGTRMSERTEDIIRKQYTDEVVSTDYAKVEEITQDERNTVKENSKIADKKHAKAKRASEETAKKYAKELLKLRKLDTSK